MILDHKNGTVIPVKGKYCNEDIFIHLSTADLNALISPNIKRGVKILGVEGTFDSDTVVNCTCPVTNIDNLDTPGEEDKYYYYEGKVYVYKNNDYIELGEPIPVVDELPDTGQENDLVYCDNALHKYIDNDWKELSVLEGEETYTPNHSGQTFLNKKKVTVNPVSVRNITYDEYNDPASIEPALINNNLVHYDNTIYKCEVQPNGTKRLVVYPNKEEVTLTVSEDNAIPISGIGLKQINIPAPQTGRVYGSIGEVWVNVDAEGINEYDASLPDTSLPDGIEGDVIKHGENYKVWQDSQWKTLDIIDNATEHTVTFTKDGYIKDDELFNKIVVPELPIVPVTDFPENPTEGDRIYKDNIIHIYKSNQWVEYIKDTHTFNYVTNQTTYTVPDGLSAKEITITGLTQEGTHASVKQLGTITPGFDPISYDASTEPDLDGYSSFAVQAVHVVDDGTLPKKDGDKAVFKNLSEMRYYDGKVYKINSETLKWELYGSSATERELEEITSRGPFSRTAPEGTSWNKVNFRVNVPTTELVKDFDTTDAATGDIGTIVHIPSKDANGNNTWGAIWKKTVGGWVQLTKEATPLTSVIEPKYTPTNISAGSVDYPNFEAFKSLNIAGVEVINWTNPNERPDTTIVAENKKIYMMNSNFSKGVTFDNGLTNGVIYQRGYDTWYPVKPLEDIDYTIQRNDDRAFIDISNNKENYGLNKVRVYLEGNKTCDEISDYATTYDPSAPLKHTDDINTTFTAIDTENPVRISLNGKCIKNDFFINTHIPKINAVFKPKNTNDSATYTAYSILDASKDNWEYKWYYDNAEHDEQDPDYKSLYQNVIFNEIEIDLSDFREVGQVLEESTINKILLSRKGYNHTPPSGIYYNIVEIPEITIPDCTDLFDPNLGNSEAGRRVCFTGEYNEVPYYKTVMKYVEDASGGTWYPDTGNIQPETVIDYMTYEGIYTADTGYEATRQIEFRYPCVKQHYGELILESATANDYNKYCITIHPEETGPSNIYKGDQYNNGYIWKPLGTMYNDKIEITPKNSDTWLDEFNINLQNYEAVRSRQVLIKGAQVPVYTTLPQDQIVLENLISNNKLYGYHNDNVYKICIINDKPEWVLMHASNGEYNITENGEYPIEDYAKVNVQVGVEKYSDLANVNINNRSADRVHICFYGSLPVQIEHKLKLIFTVNHGFGIKPSTEIRHITIPPINTVQKNLNNYNTMYLSTIYIDGFSFDIGVRNLTTIDNPEYTNKPISLYIYDPHGKIANLDEGIPAIQYALRS